MHYNVASGPHHRAVTPVCTGIRGESKEFTILASGGKQVIVFYAMYVKPVAHGALVSDAQRSRVDIS